MRKNIEAQKEKINTIKESMKLSKKDQKLLDAYVEDRLKKFETETETEEDLILRVNEIIEGSMSMDLEASAKKLDHAFDILSVLKRSYKAARENNLQDIRLQILGSTNPEIVASNFSLDSYGDFESLAPLVEAIREKRGLVPEISSILSDTYQRNKYINATAGKDGVGAFSLDSTF